MLGINRKCEGMPAKNGINWEWSESSTPLLAFRLSIPFLGKIIIWWRRRSKYVMDGCNCRLPRNNFSIDFMSWRCVLQSKRFDAGSPSWNDSKKFDPIKIHKKFFNAHL